jgi:hypothetical protein
MRFEKIYWGKDEPIAAFIPDKDNVFLREPSRIARVVLRRSLGDGVECDELRVSITDELAVQLEEANREEGHKDLEELVKGEIVHTIPHKHGQTHYMRMPAVLISVDGLQNIPLDSDPNTLESSAFYERSMRK